MCYKTLQWVEDNMIIVKQHKLYITQILKVNITEKCVTYTANAILNFSACTNLFPRLLSYFVFIYNRKQLNQFKYIWLHINSLLYHYIKSIQQIHNILSIAQKKLCSILYLHHCSIDRSTVHRTITRYRTVDR